MSGESLPYFMPIADDIGQHPSINQGLYVAAEQGAVTGADIMIAEPWANEAISELQRNYPEISLGLHIDAFPGLHYSIAGPKTFSLRSQSGEPDELVDALVEQTRRQIHAYQDRVGENPWHISGHDHAHHDVNGVIYPAFLEMLQEELGDLSASVIRGLDTQLVRHTRLSLLKAGEAPLTPEAFCELLKSTSTPVAELAAHPGLPSHDSPPIASHYTLDFRKKDLTSLLAISEGKAAQLAGYVLISPRQYLEERARSVTLSLAHTKMARS